MGFAQRRGYCGSGPPLVAQVGRMEELAQRKTRCATCPGVVAPGLHDEVEWMVGA
jgi:hypothetical protein